MKRIFSSIFCLLFLLSCASAHTLRYPAVRWLDDADKTPISEPDKRGEYKVWDYIQMQFLYQLARLSDLSRGVRGFANTIRPGTRQEALNVNNFDEVADSSWFTNRIGRFGIDPAELRKGQNKSSGPDPRGPWTILSGKTEGTTPGLIIKDKKGDVYILKLDVAGMIEMASGAEIISTKFFHAFGYNVPENYIVTFSPSILRITPESAEPQEYGKPKPFTIKNLEMILQRAATYPSGKYRALASKFLEGKPLGPFAFTGTKRTDPNDRVPHDHRRELRGYRVFSAFLQHVDSRESNTLNMFVTPKNSKQGYVKHHLIDFGSTLGSAGYRAKLKNHLYDYHFNPARIFASLITAGLYRPYWEKAQSSNLPEVGFFESKLFRPEKWRPTYPNPAFQNMTLRDGFWATKILMKLSDEDIATIVREAQYSNPQAEKYITRTLIQRKNKIGEYWFSQMNPLDDFSLQPQSKSMIIDFEDLAIQSGLETSRGTRYRYHLRPFGKGRQLTPWQESSKPQIFLTDEMSTELKTGEKYQIAIETKRSNDKFWSPPVMVVVQNDEDGLKILGVERKYR